MSDPGPLQWGDPPEPSVCKDLGKKPGPITFEFPEGDSGAQTAESHLTELYGEPLPVPARIRHALKRLAPDIKKYGSVKAFVPKLGMLYASSTGWQLATGDTTQEEKS